MEMLNPLNPFKKKTPAPEKPTDSREAEAFQAAQTRVENIIASSMAAEIQEKIKPGHIEEMTKFLRAQEKLGVPAEEIHGNIVEKLSAKFESSSTGPGEKASFAINAKQLMNDLRGVDPNTGIKLILERMNEASPHDLDSIDINTIASEPHIRGAYQSATDERYMSDSSINIIIKTLEKRISAIRKGRTQKKSIQ